MLLETAYREAIGRLQHHLPDQYTLHSEAAAAVRIILDHVTGTPYAHLRRPSKVLLPAEAELFDRSIEQLCAGVPAPYITGKREFFGREFICDERALIPRPESELLVEAAIKQFAGQGKVLLADLGCGSGCVGISVACELPQARFIATDISAQALSLAQENAQKHGVADRMQFVQGAPSEWAAPLQKVLLPEECLDGILTNPPYIPHQHRQTLQPSVRDHEPDVALFGGTDGLDEHRHIAAQCHSLLCAGGLLWTEFGDGQYEDVRAVYEAAGWQVSPAISDLAGIERMLCARR